MWVEDGDDLGRVTVAIVSLVAMGTPTIVSSNPNGGTLVRITPALCGCHASVRQESPRSIVEYLPLGGSEPPEPIWTDIEVELLSGEVAVERQLLPRQLACQVAARVAMGLDVRADIEVVRTEM